ncbi:unnamed protein product [Rotaria sordida]|uniref:LisH domain-containing protein n=1 Tax=Rotaria sordida TaxID=392033 RepID=A0A819DJR7_9BILA|nr:unnamed protein product [Rotaria sordida]CAF3836644.1 unnamed protein product [Rotaria sordida]
MSTDVMNIPTGTASSDDLSDQRGNNDNELRELVYQALERDGLISHLKAQLRAAVFKTIEKATNPIGINSHLSSDNGMTGRICRALVLDWLEHSHLLYTEDVFKVETSGPNHPVPLTHTELLEQLHINSNQIKTQPILHVLLDHSTNRPASIINSLPDHIKQSIDNQFPNEKINDLNRIRNHFRSLFSSSFDSSVLDTFINKNIPSSTNSLSKHDYEQICLRWMQGCANALKPPSIPIQQVSSIVSTQLLTSRNTANNNQVSTPIRRTASPPTDSISSSSSSENPRKLAYDFPLPTTMNSQQNVIKKAADIVPPSLINFDESDNSDEQEEDGSTSIFSNRNATPAALERLKTIDNIMQGNETPRTRTIPKKPLNNGTKDLPIEYDDESMSHSVSHSIISSMDDITVDKASPSPSTNIDYLEDF